MSKVKFTEEQQQELRNNKYTASVTTNSLSFTKEFKELFYNEYLTGVLPREILRRYGYPVETLGKRWIWEIAHCIKKEYESNGSFRDVRSPRPAPARSEELTPEQQIKQLQQKLDYLTQEVEFLKKISSIRNIRKQVQLL